MWRRILALLAALFVALTVSTPAARAQKLENRWKPSTPAADDDSRERGPPALQYTVATASTILVLVVLCMPSRKRVIG
jgi:hypothetical protein